MSRRRWIRLPSRLFVEFGRNTPIIVQLIWVHYALPDIIGVKFTPFTSSLIALTLQTSGYLAEEYRGGIQGIHPGQSEAARSLGLKGGPGDAPGRVAASRRPYLGLLTSS